MNIGGQHRSDKRWNYLNKASLFWALLALFLLANLPRLLQNPSLFADQRGAPVVISEFLARNQSGITDDEGDHVDWIELYNDSAMPVDLAGWSLTDDPDLPAKWLLPAVTLPAKRYLLVYASGKNGHSDVAATAENPDPLPILHTNFRLSGDGGFLALYPPTTRRFLDSAGIDYGPQRIDLSYGRVPAAALDATETIAYRFFTQPTPGAPNDLTAMMPTETAPVQFSVVHGLYEAPVQLGLQSETAGAQLWYTTDGSIPTPETAHRYDAPLLLNTTTVVRAIALAEGFSPSLPRTQSYLFPTALLQQPADPPAMPATWGTHRLTFAGATAGDPVVADYAMDTRITQDVDAQPKLLAGLHDLPSLALTMSPQAFTELYSDPQRRGQEAEYATSVELLPTTDEPGFQLDAGIRIQGGAGRWEYMPKHSFRLFFKDSYGASKLPYQFFADSPVDEFDTLVLRAGVDRSFAGHPDTPDLRQTTYARDEWARASQIAMSGVGAHGRFVHLYINGLYWGLYNVVERPDASFAAAYYGGDKDEWGANNHGGTISGPFDRFGTLIRLAQAGGLADATAYATMLEFIDPVQFSDYLILNWYAGNVDWPENNWYAAVQSPAGRNRFFVWDAERTWDEGALLHLGVDQVEGAPFPNVIKLVFDALIENADYRLLFADRLYHHLAVDGALSPAVAQARWTQITTPLTNAIVAESARWGDVRAVEPMTQADWQRAATAVEQQMVDNANRLIALTRDAGYYPPIDPPQIAAIASDATPETTAPRFVDEVTVALTDPSTMGLPGAIYYTVDGTDPRVTGHGAVAPTAMRYRAPFTLTTSTVVKARLRIGGDEDASWSALAETSFFRATDRADVRISELMYHAQEGAGYEYLELQNMGTLPADLSRAYFDGITYRFEEGATLAPGEYFVLIRDFRDFRERYPTAEFNGIYSGELSNYGETITLHHSDGSVITAVTYSPANGWPVTAAGLGDSATLVHAAGDPNVGSNWRASSNLYGSPGQDDGEALP